MGWFDQHLWAFTIGRQSYGPSMDDGWGTTPSADAMTVCLRDVLKPRRTTIDYMYDFGDSWAHRLTVTKIRAGEPGVSYPHYVGGEWACPPEDCGGIPGYDTVLDAIADPEHPDRAELAEYFEDWDPNAIEALPLQVALGRIANRPNATRTRIAKKAK